MYKILRLAFAAVISIAPSICLAQTLLLEASDQSQNASAKAPIVSGFSFYTSTTGTHDSSSGWSLVTDSGARYDFNRFFAVQAGIPYYISHSGFATTSGITATNPPAPPPLTTRYNSWGDLYLNLIFSEPGPLGYRATVTATAPTGDTSNGISTGRPTFDLNNHLEHDFGLVTPLLEFGIGDSSALIDKRIRRPFTTLGAIAHFRAGAGFDFFKVFNFQASGYENLPIGNQKVFSHLFVHSSKGNTVTVVKNGKGKQRFSQVAVDAGQGILEDNGFTGDLTVTLRKNVDLTATYEHSVRQSLDIAEVGVSFHWGKVRNAGVQ
ncbi:MAG TPA: hypothetical protein VKT33_08210 [Candidatus Angelobacter sp.]|nr:hypothetical protein [Candidatus Angelobacter sp.]